MATLQTLPEAATLLAPGTAAGPTTLAARSFLYAVFKHRRLVVGIFLLVALASAVAALMRPRSWRATAKVLVKLGETVQLAPAEAPSRSVYLPLSQEVVKTEAEIVKSWEVVKEASARVGVQPEPGTALAEMIASMQLALTVMPVAGSNVLQISYLGRNPERAARMANAITDVYIDHHNRVYRTEGVHDFYTGQLRVLEAETRATQSRLRDYMEKHGVVDVEQEIQILTREAIMQEKGLRHHRGKIGGNARRAAAVREQLARTPAEIAYSQEYHANPTLRAFTDKLTDLEIKRYQLLQIYLPNDRHVQDVTEEIARIRGRMKGEEERVLSGTLVRQNDLHAELHRNLLTLDVHAADLRGHEPALAQRLQATRKRLHKLSTLRFRIATLKRDYDDKANALELYRKKQEEARITEAMKNQAMVNVSIVERATAPLEPVSGLLLPLLVGLMGGLGLASAMAVAVEYVNRRLRFEEEVERYLELPVLAVIPDLETTSAIARA